LLLKPKFSGIEKIKTIGSTYMLASGLRPGKEDGMGVSFILLSSSKCMIILAERGFETKVRYCLDMEIDALACLSYKRLLVCRLNLVFVSREILYSWE